jgi:hypothetical protein
MHVRYHALITLQTQERMHVQVMFPPLERAIHHQ